MKQLRKFWRALLYLIDQKRVGSDLQDVNPTGKCSFSTYKYSFVFTIVLWENWGSALSSAEEPQIGNNMQKHGRTSSKGQALKQKSKVSVPYRLLPLSKKQQKNSNFKFAYLRKANWSFDLCNQRVVFSFSLGHTCLRNNFKNWKIDFVSEASVHGRLVPLPWAWHESEDRGREVGHSHSPHGSQEVAKQGIDQGTKYIFPGCILWPTLLPPQPYLLPYTTVQQCHHIMNPPRYKCREILF